MRSKSFMIASVLVLATIAAADSAPVRPKITGVSHLAVYTSDPAAAERYYAVILGAAKLPDPENPKGVRYAFNPTQFVEVLPLPPNPGINRLDHTAYNTENAEGLRKYLAAKGWKTPAAVTKRSDGGRSFTVLDPEGNNVEFVQPPANAKAPEAPNLIGRHIIHIGILVRDRAAQDKFYRDLLGFRPYWFGGMQEDKIDWVSQQVPDGHDWLEYMVAGGSPATGFPTDMTQQRLGVLDHIAIGEKSVDDAFKVLQAGNRLEGRHDVGPKTGRDGKRQFNMYDPDGIRAELMTFHAVEKPCCSPFTAEDPAE